MKKLSKSPSNRTRREKYIPTGRKVGRPRIHADGKRVGHHLYLRQNALHVGRLKRFRGALGLRRIY